jgi:UDP-N-acetylmuramoyl-tripeptide--D-alanyl-D-alanine ligase
MSATFTGTEVSSILGTAPLDRAIAFGGVSTDTRSIAKNDLFVALKGDRFDAHQFLGDAAARGATGAVVKRGAQRSATPPEFVLFEVEDPLASLGALARFHRRRFSVPVVGITGSTGKTTTKEMIAAVLSVRGPVLKTEGNLNNEIGVPLTCFRLAGIHTAAVIEMGMNQPGEMARLASIAEPRVGIVTNAQAAHLAGVGSVDQVAKEKGALYRGLVGRTAISVANLDDPRMMAQAKDAGHPIVTYGRSAGAEVRLSGIDRHDAGGLEIRIAFGGRDFAVRLGFVGEHNAHNACGAFAVGIALDFRPEECARGLGLAKGWAHRMAVGRLPGGVTVLDDCYNANPASMAAALEALAALAKGGRAVAVLGDMLELGDFELEAHRHLGELAASRAKIVALFGPRSEAAAAPLRASLGDGAVGHFPATESISEVVAWLKPKLQAGDVVLVKGSRGMKLERVVDALGGGTPRS